MEEDSYIFDTPGFSSLELMGLEKEELRYYFPEFAPYEGSCRFQGCVHGQEPGCAVKEAVKQGKINRERYESYRLLFGELQEKREEEIQLDYEKIFYTIHFISRFAPLGEDIQHAAAAGTQYLHYDVMDGMFVPSISFGMPVLEPSER